MKQLIESAITKDAVSFKEELTEELSRRIAAILKEQMDEAVELTELSKTTLHNYVQKAVTDYGYHNRWKGRNPNDMEAKRGAGKRKEGITRAVTKLAEGEELTEAFNISKHHKVAHDEASKHFAKEYTAAHKGDHREGGPTDKDQAASEKFWGKYKTKTVRSGFGGSGEQIFSDGSNKYRVERTPNGKTFYGTDHLITKINESEELLEAKNLRDYDWPESDLHPGSSLEDHARNAIRHGMYVHDALDHIYGAVTGKKRDWVKTNRSDLIKTFKSHGLKESEQLDEISQATLKSYTKHASADSVNQVKTYNRAPDNSEEQTTAFRKYFNRSKGIRRANRLSGSDENLKGTHFGPKQ